MSMGALPRDLVTSHVNWSAAYLRVHVCVDKSVRVGPCKVVFGNGELRGLGGNGLVREIGGGGGGASEICAPAALP
jgi:hypothetical protein